MSGLLAAAAAKPAGGAPIADVALAGGTAAVLTLLTLSVVTRYRRGGARGLRRLLAASERLVRVPGWAAVPGLGTIACALVTIWGATWDIGLHIDVGRDEGPLGTAAHYPLLLGLLGTFLMGVLAIGVAPAAPRPTSGAAFALGGRRVPAGAVLLASASAFAMLGFPLDDVWHRIFGQDVTLWGPTHTMFIGGVMAAAVGATLLLAEGARAAGGEPFPARGLWQRCLPALLAGIFLYLWTAALHEFNWGVPQYRAVWQPLLLAFGGAHALVLARLLGGRGGTLGALLVWLPMQVAMTLVIGGPLGVTMPAMPLFLTEAALVEALAARGEPRRPVRFGALAGLAIGTVGLAANFAWSQVAMPLPWSTALLPEAVPVAALAGVAGGILGALMAEGLTRRVAGRRVLACALAAAAVALALGVNAAETEAPGDVRAALTLTSAREEAVPGAARTKVADVEVRFSDPSLGRDATWAYVLAWQGGGRRLSRLVPQPDGSFRAAGPLPVGGGWKSFVRVHEGRSMLAAPVRMPPDPPVGFPGYRAEPRTTRAMVSDTELLQVERRKDGPRWAWTPAMLLVLGSDLLLVVLMAWICVRLGRAAGSRSSDATVAPARAGERVAASAPAGGARRSAPSPEPTAGEGGRPLSGAESRRASPKLRRAAVAAGRWARRGPGALSPPRR